jgi:hypothetical protein
LDACELIGFANLMLAMCGPRGLGGKSKFGGGSTWFTGDVVEGVGGTL